MLRLCCKNSWKYLRVLKKARTFALAFGQKPKLKKEFFEAFKYMRE